MTMANSSDLTAAERKLAGARISFNIERQQLQTVLQRLNAPPASHDHLINAADEFGVDHALSTLGKDPAAFGIDRSVREADIALLRPLLAKAYEAGHRVDAALAEREALLLSRNPGHVKVFQVGDEEVAYDPERRVLIYANHKREAHEDVTYVRTRDEGRTQDNDRDA